MLLNYVKIARVDHWFKNIFMLPGFALAFVFANTPLDQIWWQLIAGLFSVCLIASANYTINEWLDAEFDQQHPVKKSRPSAVGLIKPQFVYLQWFVLATAGLGLGWSVLSVEFTVCNSILLIMGVLYNVKPFRTKDRVFLDVLSESINNPLRFLLGWFVVVQGVFPPSSVLLAYWMGGAFLMGVKRYAEYRFIDDPHRAGLYRRSFQSYTEEKLLISSFFYALASVFFLGVFLVKYRIEFLLSFPLFSLLFAWYLHIGLQPHSPAQDPEKLYREKWFILYIIFLCTVVGILFFVDIPILHLLMSRVEY
jgi:decaprenyl-phosphate phosphoribosyltransferase